MEEFVYMLGGFVIGLFLLLLIAFIVYFVALWKLYKKCGRKGWESIIPFYSIWVLAEIAGLAWWHPLIIIISGFSVLSDTGLEWMLNLASIVSNFFICYNISKKFHKDAGFAILLTIFPFVMIPILAFNKNFQYDSTVVVSENGPISFNDNSNNHNNNNNSGKRFCQYCGKEINANAHFCGNCGNEIK